MKLSSVKFTGKREDNGEWVEGDLIRKGSRFGGSYHYIYVDGDFDEEAKEYLVDASTVELVVGNKLYKQK